MKNLLIIMSGALLGQIIATSFIIISILIQILHAHILIGCGVGDIGIFGLNIHVENRCVITPPVKQKQPTITSMDGVG